VSNAPPCPTKADILAEASEKAQLELKLKLRQVQTKRLEVATRLDRLNSRVKTHKDHKAAIVKFGDMTEERNAKDYLKHAQMMALQRIAVVKEARNRLYEKVEAQKQAQAKVAAKQLVIKEQDNVLLGKLNKDLKERNKLNQMMDMENQLARGVKESQGARDADMMSKLNFDKMTEESLVEKLNFETKQESKLAVEMAKIVNHEQAVNKVQVQDIVAEKDQQLKKVTEELSRVKDELVDCGKGTKNSGASFVAEQMESGLATPTAASTNLPTHMEDGTAGPPSPSSSLSESAAADEASAQVTAQSKDDKLINDAVAGAAEESEAQPATDPAPID